MPSFTLTLGFFCKSHCPMDPNKTDPTNPNVSQPDLSTLSPTPQSPTDTPVPPQSEPLPTGGTPLPDLTSAQPPILSDPMPAPALPENPLPPSSPPDPAAIPAQPDFNPPPQEPAPIGSGSTPTFVPPAPAPIDSGPSENPATATDFGTSTGSFNWSDSSSGSPPPTAADALNIPNPITSQPSEPAPSDLSHLVNASEVPSLADAGFTLPVTQPDTIVSAATSPGIDVPNVPTEENHKSFPKWAIGVGVGLLLAVAGASAYFILGIGKTPPPASIPATETQNKTTTAPVIQPTAIPTIAIPTATPSAGVSLPGGSGTQATSAADLLKQKQGK